MMRRFLLSLVLGTLAVPVLASDKPAERNTAPPNVRANGSSPVPTPLPPPVQTPEALPALPGSNPAVDSEPVSPASEPGRAPARPRSTAPVQPTSEPVRIRQQPVPAPQRHHPGPIRATVRYADWIWTRGMIVLCGYPKPRDVQKRAAEPQAYTLPQTKPAPPPRPPHWLFHH